MELAAMIVNAIHKYEDKRRKKREEGQSRAKSMTNESDSEGLRREIKQKGREEAIEITMRRTMKV